MIHKKMYRGVVAVINHQFKNAMTVFKRVVKMGGDANGTLDVATLSLLLVTAVIVWISI